ncbi:MAG: hypothetical protein ACYS0G_01630 [Planctomycetota bacterium]|jgi:hypothetical protein
MIPAALAIFVLAVVWVGVLGLGAAVAWRGLRGRLVDRDPRCGRCAYILVGFPRRPQRCPECGFRLLRPGAVRLGRHEPRRALIVAGGLILLAGLSPVGVGLGSDGAAATTNPGPPAVTALGRNASQRAWSVFPPPRFTPTRGASRISERARRPRVDVSTGDGAYEPWPPASFGAGDVGSTLLGASELEALVRGPIAQGPGVWQRTASKAGPELRPSLPKSGFEGWPSPGTRPPKSRRGSDVPLEPIVKAVDGSPIRQPAKPAPAALRRADETLPRNWKIEPDTVTMRIPSAQVRGRKIGAPWSRPRPTRPFAPRTSSAAARCPPDRAGCSGPVRELPG